MNHLLLIKNENMLVNSSTVHLTNENLRNSIRTRPSRPSLRNLKLQPLIPYLVTNSVHPKRENGQPVTRCYHGPVACWVSMYQHKNWGDG